MRVPNGISRAMTESRTNRGSSISFLGSTRQRGAKVKSHLRCPDGAAPLEKGYFFFFLLVVEAFGFSLLAESLSFSFNPANVASSDGDRLGRPTMTPIEMEP
jgi:hypothetical protein